MSQAEPESSHRDDIPQQEGAPEQPTLSSVQRFMVVAIESLGLLKSSVDLLLLELMLALKTIPKIIAVSIGLAFFSALAWIAFSVVLAWLAYAFFNSVGAGLFCFLFVQLAVIAALGLVLKRYKSTLSLPNSRKQAKEIIEVFHESFTTSKAKENGRD